jgi:hypothetical protein
VLVRFDELARLRRRDRPPRIPGDLEDHERDQQADDRVPDLGTKRDDDRAGHHAQRDKAVDASVVAVRHPLLGVGMATAIFLDATVVRMVLVPALMQLFGRANWWIPRWLDRRLPRVDFARATVADEA